VTLAAGRLASRRYPHTNSPTVAWGRSRIRDIGKCLLSSKGSQKGPRRSSNAVAETKFNFFGKRYWRPSLSTFGQGTAFPTFGLGHKRTFPAACLTSAFETLDMQHQPPVGNNKAVNSHLVVVDRERAIANDAMAAHQCGWLRPKSQGRTIFVTSTRRRLRGRALLWSARAQREWHRAPQSTWQRGIALRYRPQSYPHRERASGSRSWVVAAKDIHE
jgi:hypothetical protein